MKLRTACFALLLLMCAAAAHAQLAVDTARGLVGGKVRVTLRAPAMPVSRTGSVTLVATLRLGNPTVFYPERFIAPAGDTLTSSLLRAQKDSIYSIAFTVRRDAANPAAGDTLITLEGEALAGSDTACALNITDVAFNDAPADDAHGVVITHSVGPQLPYVRFAILEQNYPNPVSRGTPTTWAYRIDKRSDVTFHFYDLLGKEIYAEYLGVIDIGPHIYVYHPPPTLPTGTYYVRLETNSGSADKVMHILH